MCASPSLGEARSELDPPGASGEAAPHAAPGALETPFFPRRGAAF